MSIQQLKTIGLLWSICQAISVQAITQPSSSVSFKPSIPSNSASVKTSTSQKWGPFLEHTASCWSLYYTPKVVGTVVITVDQVHDQTMSTTIYNTEVVQSSGSKSGKLEIFTRTDVNSDGTVTQIVAGETLTYPTNYNHLNATLTWDVIQAVPGATHDPGSCCFSTQSFKPTPFPTTVAPPMPSLDQDDLVGWKYKLGYCPDVHFENYLTYKEAEVSSIFKNASITIDYEGCDYTMCSSQPGSAKAPYAVSNVVNILATSTTTLSSVDATTTSHSSTHITAQPELMSSSTPAKTSTSSSTTSTTAARSSSSTSSTSVSVLSTSSGKTEEQTPNTLHTSVGPSTSSSKTVEQQSSTSSANTPVPASSHSSAASAPANTPIVAPSSPPGAQLISQAQPNSVQSSSTLLQPPTTIAFSANPPSPAVQSSAADNHNTQWGPAAQSTAKIQSTKQNSAPPASVDNHSSSLASAQATNVQTQITSALSALPVITAGSTMITANSASLYIINSQTLRPGSSITISGSVISYPSASPTPASLPPISIGSTVITPVSSKYFIAGQTLVPNAAIVVSGTTISLASGATQLVVGSSTSALVSTSTTGPGGFIYSAIANQPSVSATVTTGRSSSGTASASAAHYSGDAQQLHLQNSFLALPIFVAALVFDVL